MCETVLLYNENKSFDQGYRGRPKTRLRSTGLPVHILAVVVILITNPPCNTEVPFAAFGRP